MREYKGDLIVLCVSLQTIVAKKCSNKVCNIKIGKIQSSLSFSLNCEKDEIKKKNVYNQKCALSL